jgi:RHS repeat-associated protein
MWAYDYYANNLLQQLTLTGIDQTKFTVNYEYDPAGNRTIVSDTSKIENTILYNEQASDPLNRINSVKREFDGKIYLSEYGYKKNGQMTSSELTEYKYDNVGQLIAIPYPDAISKRIYNYDDFNQLNEVQGLTQKAGITYWADGLPQSIALVNGVNTNFGYDDNRRLQELNISGKNDIINYNYHYDAANNIKIIHNGKTNLDNSHNYYDNNQLKLAMVPGTFAEKDPTTGTPGLKEQDYLADACFDFTLEPALAVKLDYNASSIGLDFGTIAPKLKKIELIADAACQNLCLSSDALDLYISSDNINYSLIPNSEWMFKMGINGTVITLTKTWSARYLKIHVKCDERDADNVPVDQATFLNDLVNMVKVYQEASSECEEYQYDEAGNRTQLKETLVQSKTNLYSYYPSSNRLKTDGKYLYVYDLNGNLIKKGNTYNNIFGEVFIFTTSGKNVEYWEYKYDLMNRLTEVWTNGTNGITEVAEYGYDPEGLRVVKRSNGETIHYIFEGTEPVFERRITSNQIRSYVYALGKHLARVDGVIGDNHVETYFYHSDNAGTIRAITDQQGQVVWNADYLAFGSQFGKVGDLDEQHGFTGKEFDQDTGLYYYNARWYNSEIGRFISEDPGADPNSPNLYSYCTNNPLIETDPTGKWAQNANGDWVCNDHNDTLWSLSQRVYGDGSQWQLLNFGKDPCKLQINDTLSSEKFGKANTFINAMTSAEQFRFDVSENLKYIPGVNILNDAFGTLTGQDLTGTLLTPTERTRSAFSTMITAATFGAGAYLSSLEETAAISLEETAANSASTISKVRPDFYVTPDGVTIPGTGFRYGYGEIPSSNIIEPGLAGIRYVGFSEYSTGLAAKSSYQLESIPTWRAPFDSLQTIDTLRTPFAYGNQGYPLLEPFCFSYPELGTGGGYQSITENSFVVDGFLHLP